MTIRFHLEVSSEKDNLIELASYAVVNDASEEIISGYELTSCVNKQALNGSIKAISDILDYRDHEIYLSTSNKYLVDGINIWCSKWMKTNWITSERKPVEFKDLWSEVISLRNITGAKFIHLPAGSGNKFQKLAKASCQTACY